MTDSKANSGDYNSTKYYALTGTSDATLNNSSATKYTFIQDRTGVSGATQLMTKSVTIEDNDFNAGKLHVEKAASKLYVLEWIVGRYDAFTTANVEFKSERSEDGKTVYYQLTDDETGVYAPYNTFDAAVKKYTEAGYDVAAVKGYIFDTTSAKKDEAVYNAFRADIDGCATVAEIVNVIKSYKDKVGSAFTLVDGVDAYTVEEVSFGV